MKWKSALKVVRVVACPYLEVMLLLLLIIYKEFIFVIGMFSFCMMDGVECKMKFVYDVECDHTCLTFGVFHSKYNSHIMFSYNKTNRTWHLYLYTKKNIGVDRSILIVGEK